MKEWYITQLIDHPGQGESDHITLTFDLVCCNDQVDKPLSQPDFFKAEYAEISLLKTSTGNGTLNGNFIAGYEEFMRVLTA